MGRPKKPDNQQTNVFQMPPEPAGNVTVAEPDPQTETKAAGPPPPPREPPKTAATAAPRPKSPAFFQKVAAIPAADWGKRAYVYVYCYEPICNLKISGETKYLVRLDQPIYDEQPLMIDYGSGKYHLKLVQRKPGTGDGEMVDSTEIEIYNPKYPPKIPRSAWLNDPRNERWAALLPKEEPPAAPTGLGTVTEAFQTFTQIRKDMREELNPAAAPAGPPVDPMASTLQMVQTIMSMKADNPMVEIMKEQLRASNEQAEKAREREASLQKELRDSMRALVANPAQPQKNGVGQLKEILADVKEFLPSIKELLPQVGETVRAGRTTWLDIVREAAPTVIDASRQVIVALASRPVNGAYPPPQPPPAGLPAPNGTQQPNPAQTASQQLSSDQRIMMLLQQPLPLNAFRNYFQGACKVPPTNGGGDFAEWLFDGVGEEPLKDLRGMGRDRIMQLFKAHPAWPMLAAQEAQLTEFVDQVLAWQPAPEESEDDDEEGVDLTAQGV